MKPPKNKRPRVLRTAAPTLCDFPQQQLKPVRRFLQRTDGQTGIFPRKVQLGELSVSVSIYSWRL